MIGRDTFLLCHVLVAELSCYTVYCDVGALSMTTHGCLICTVRSQLLAISLLAAWMV